MATRFYLPSSKTKKANVNKPWNDIISDPVKETEKIEEKTLDDVVYLIVSAHRDRLQVRAGCIVKDILFKSYLTPPTDKRNQSGRKRPKRTKKE